MFAVAGFFYYTYRRGLRIMNEKKEVESKTEFKSKKIEDRLKRK
jgi:hypothetical protein